MVARNLHKGVYCIDLLLANFIDFEFQALTKAQTRAVLIVSGSIKDTEETKRSVVEQLVANRDEQTTIRSLIYGTTEESAAFTATLLAPKTIGNATLLAARGVHMGIDKKVEAAGGLHVICTFFPHNQRVQAQVFGRSARGGQLGSGEIITLLSSVQQVLGDKFPQNGPISTEVLTELRNELVDEYLKRYIRDQLPFSTLRGKLYKRICKAMDKFRAMTKEKNEEELEINLMNKNGKLTTKVDEKKRPDKSAPNHSFIVPDEIKYALRQIEERWALWRDKELKRLEKLKKENPNMPAK